MLKGLRHALHDEVPRELGLTGFPDVEGIETFAFGAAAIAASV